MRSSETLLAPSNVSVFPEPRPQMMETDARALEAMAIQYATNIEGVRKSISKKYADDMEKWENPRLEWSTRGRGLGTERVKGDKTFFRHIDLNIPNTLSTMAGSKTNS